MVIMGYMAAVLIGISLGLIGGGGSILTVPVLVYLFGINPVTASAYSLFIVGSASMVGAVGKVRQQLVSYQSVLYFGLPSLLTVFVTRKWIVPAMPEVFFSVGDLHFTKPVFTILLFAVLMIAAALLMIRDKAITTADAVPVLNPVRIALQGIVTGFITGLVGAGGGFLIVPALIWLLGLPVKTAIGSSLLIIAINSLVGFMGDVMNSPIEWRLVFSVAALAMGGIWIGNTLSKRIAAIYLKKGFGWFVLGMGIYIILKELFL